MKIKLWSIQDERGWHELKTKRRLTVKEEFIDSDFKAGFDWMKDQMKKRIGMPGHIDQYPIWAWYQAKDINNRRPDLRESGYLLRGTIGYRIEFEKEKEEVLLSDFYLWDSTPSYHKSFIGNSAQEQSWFEEELIKQGENRTYEKLPPNLRRMMEKSWERIFDLNFETDAWPYPYEKKCIQATMWDLKMAEVIKVDKFRAR